MKPHQPNACWKCHDWNYIDIDGRMVATYCETCAITVTEWIDWSTLGSRGTDKISPPEKGVP